MYRNNILSVLGYPPYQESTGFSSKSQPSEEDRAAIVELFNRKQALTLELQHYEATANSGNSGGGFSLEPADQPTTMPTNTRLHVATTADINDVRSATYTIISA